MDQSTIALLHKLLRFLNAQPRTKRAGLDSYELAAEVEKHMKETK